MTELLKLGRRKNMDGELSFKPVIRYIIWLYVVVLLAELLVASFSAMRAMQREAKFVVNSTKSQVEYRVGNTITLLTSLANDPAFSDPATSYIDKAVTLNQYSSAFGYMMICIVDQDVNVWDENGTDANLAGRAYMQRLFATGEVQVTDSFAAGADGVTLNYTVAVPIMKDGLVNGCLFASIYFDEVEQMLMANAYDSYQQLSLFGSENQVMSIPNVDQYGIPYIELSKNGKLLGTTAKRVEENMYNKTGGSHWYLGNGNLEYVCYVPVANTHWTLMCRLNFWGTLLQFLPQLVGMLAISTVTCGILVVLSNRYIHAQRGTVDMLISSVQELEKKIYQNEKPDNVDFKEIISLTSKGLTDGLTGVITRTVFLNQVPNKLKALEKGTFAAMCFVDMDDLKTINDTYGHDMGDMALKSVGYVLREYEKKQDGLVGRYGGDEFVILLTGFASVESLEDLLREMCIRLHSQVSSESATIPIQCSIGVSICDSQDADVEKLIKRADEMLYAVKQTGKGRYQIYS